MWKKINFFFLFLTLIIQEQCQDYDKDTIRTLSCLNFLRKLKINNQDQQYLSSVLLSCFINIDESLEQKLISSQSPDSMPLSESEKDKLMDLSDIQTKYSQNELIDFSQRLNSAMEQLKEMNSGGGRNYQSSKRGGGKKNENNRSQGVGLFGLFIQNFFNMLNPHNSFFPIIIILVVTFYTLKALRKFFSNKDEKKKKN